MYRPPGQKSGHFSQVAASGGLLIISVGPSRNRRGIDIHAMVDAISAVMAMEDKEFYKVGELAVAVMIETATAITGDAYKVTIS